MSKPWENKKTHRLGQYVIYSVRGGQDKPRKWYTEVHMHSRHGLIYRASYGSNAPARLLAVLSSFIRYKMERP